MSPCNLAQLRVLQVPQSLHVKHELSHRILPLGSTPANSYIDNDTTIVKSRDDSDNACGMLSEAILCYVRNPLTATHTLPRRVCPSISNNDYVKNQRIDTTNDNNNSIMTPRGLNCENNLRRIAGLLVRQTRFRNRFRPKNSSGLPPGLERPIYLRPSARDPFKLAGE